MAVLPVVGAPEEMAKLMGQHRRARELPVFNDREREALVGRVVDAAEDEAQAAAREIAASERQAHEVGARRVAQSVDLVHLGVVRSR